MNRARKSSYCLLACIALLFAVVAAAVFAADPRVETVDATGARQVYVPQTQPADVLPRIEVLDVDGMRQIFVPQRLAETPPATEPATQPATKPSAVLYAEMGGIPAAARSVASGDVSKLSGDVLLTSTSGYTASGDVKARLWAKAPGTVVTVAAGKQITIRAHQAGITYDGKGKAGLKADDDNTHAMVLVADGVHLHTFRATGSQGVGCNIVGKHVVAWSPEWDHNGAQGRGARTKGDAGVEGSGYTEYDGRYHDNNALGLTNAGNKYTRCTWILLVRPHFYRERGGCLWADNYNEFILIVDPWFDLPAAADRKGRDVFAFRSELGMPGGTRIIRPRFADGFDTDLSIDESSNITVEDPTFGKCGAAIVLRNLLRGDDLTGKWTKKNGKQVPVDEKAFTCRLWNFNLSGAIYLPGAGAIETSGATVPGVTVSQTNNRLTFGPARSGKQVVKVPN